MVIAKVWTSMGAALVLGGCGPSVAGDGSGGSGSGGSDGDGSGHDTTAVVDDTGMGSSSGGAETAWCLRGQEQPALDVSDTVLQITDADGDGRDEVWMGPNPFLMPVEGFASRVRVYELSDGGTLERVAETTIDGHVYTTTDIDGDGVLDVIVRQLEQPEPWWQAGLGDLTVSPVQRPLAAPTAQAIGVDADGDGLGDLLELVQNEDGIGLSGARLHMGDGLGGTTPGDELRLEGIDILDNIVIWPSPIPGQILVRFRELSLGASPSIFHAIAVDGAGAISTLGASSLVEIGIRHVGDLDGDGIIDALGIAQDAHELLYLPSSESYGERILASDVAQLAAGPLVEATGIDLLSFDLDGAAVLRRPQGDDWPTALPVELEQGEWGTSTAPQPMQADGEGGMELLVRTNAYWLWQLEPCE
ncbi:MAG: VCBS repeat-containing protein [Myxococcales bacterium]|nr:VCBS repeat-containing protein [Myxococcales bacterium]